DPRVMRRNFQPGDDGAELLVSTARQLGRRAQIAWYCSRIVIHRTAQLVLCCGHLLLFSDDGPAHVRPHAYRTNGRQLELCSKGLERSRAGMSRRLESRNLDTEVAACKSGALFVNSCKRRASPSGRSAPKRRSSKRWSRWPTRTSARWSWSRTAWR